jgi:hypothetical protein
VRFFVLLVVVAIASPVVATEPDGHIRLRTEWVQPEAGHGSPVVRLSIRSLVPLDEATLTVSTPVDFALRSVAPTAEASFRAVPAAQDRLAIRRGLQRLDPAETSTLDFVLTLSPGRNGVIEFIVEGRDSSGRIIRSAIGLAAGESSSAGVQRLGAIEFPATVLPATEKR